MNSAQIEENVRRLVIDFDKETFIYDLLLAYDHPKASVARLQNGGLNQAKIAGDIAWKKKTVFPVRADGATAFRI